MTQVVSYRGLIGHLAQRELRHADRLAVLAGREERPGPRRRPGPLQPTHAVRGASQQIFDLLEAPSPARLLGLTAISVATFLGGWAIYLIQDFEPMSYPAGTNYALAKETYNFGLYGLCNTERLLDIYRCDDGGQGMAFIPEGAGPMLLALRVAAGSAVPERDALAEQVSALRDQVASLAWHLRVREEELEQARAEAASLRHAVERNIGIRARRKIGEVLHKA